MSDLIADASPSPSGVSDEISNKRSLTGALFQGARTGAPVVPFLAYVTLGLLIPTVVIINLAFRTSKGKLTWSNIRTILSAGHTHAGILIGGQYRAGFENSLKLALVT